MYRSSASFTIVIPLSDYWPDAPRADISAPLMEDVLIVGLAARGCKDADRASEG
jgi:hypothetical protein